MAAISTWSKTPASNNMAAPDGAPEGWLPSAVNDWARTTMSEVRTWYEQASWLDFGHSPTYVSAASFTIPTDLTDVYTIGRRVKTFAGSNSYATITSATYDGSTKTTVFLSTDPGYSGADASLSAVAVGIIDPSDNAFPLAAAIPSGTSMLFYQAAAPHGWTQVTAISDHAVRVVDTGGGTVGGSVSFSTVFGTYTIAPVTGTSTSGAAVLTAGSLAIKYANVIVATKD